MSNTLTFFQRTNEGENFLYCSEETKYIYFHIFDNSYLKITEQNEESDYIIYDSTISNVTSNLFEFKKNKNYYISFNSYDNNPIIIQIFKELNNFKHNFANGPLFLSGQDVEYNYEIDISNYNIGDNLVFAFFGFCDTLIRIVKKVCQTILLT